MKPRSIIKSNELCLLIFIIMLLSGCWDRQELNDLALIMAAGFDIKSDHKIELSVLVFIPKGGGSQQGMDVSGEIGGGEQTLVRSAEGVTIADAMSKLQEILPRKIFWGHTDVFIFNEDLAKKGVSKQVDFIMRHPQLRERGQIFVSKQKAKDILKLISPLERDLSEVLRELGEHKIGLSVTTKELSEMLIGDSKDYALPWIKILPAESSKNPKQTIAYITGTTIFKQDKMVGKIDDSLKRGLLWLRNEIRLAVVTIKPPNTDGYISLNLYNAKSELTPEIKNGKWKIVLHAESSSDIVQNTTNLDVSNPAIVKKLEHYLQEEIEKRIELSRNRVQKKMKADVFGFAEAFHRKYPEIWNREKDDWNEIFPKVEVTYDIKTKIRRQGLTS